MVNVAYDNGIDVPLLRRQATAGFDTPQDFAMARTPTQSKRLLNQQWPAA